MKAISYGLIALGMSCCVCSIDLLKGSKKGQNQAESSSAGIGDFIALNMEYAYKQGQIDAMHGKINVRVYTNGSNQEVWEWSGSPWVGKSQPHAPAVVDAHYDTNIMERLDK